MHQHTRLPVAARRTGIQLFLIVALFPVISQAGLLPDPPTSFDPLPEATRITLHLENVPPAAAFKKFSEFSGVEYAPDNRSFLNLGTQTVSIDAEKRPYWEVFHELFSKCNVVGYRLPDPRHETWALSRDTFFYNSCPRLISGPFSIDATKISMGRSIVYGAPASDPNAIGLTLNISAEPHLAALNCGEVKVDACTDENGKGITLLPDRWLARSNFSSSSAQLFVKMQPDRSAKRIATIRGSIPVAILDAFKTLEVSPIAMADHQEKEVAGLIFVVTYKKLGAGCNVDIHINHDPDNSTDNERMQLLHLSQMTLAPKLLDDQGVPYAMISGSGGIDGWNLNFRKTLVQPAPYEVGEPSKLEWQIPTKLKWVSVPFEFHNLPLR